MTSLRPCKCTVSSTYYYVMRSAYFSLAYAMNLTMTCHCQVNQDRSPQSEGWINRQNQVFDVAILGAYLSQFQIGQASLRSLRSLCHCVMSRGVIDYEKMLLHFSVTPDPVYLNLRPSHNHPLSNSTLAGPSAPWPVVP